MLIAKITRLFKSNQSARAQTPCLLSTWRVKVKHFAVFSDTTDVQAAGSFICHVTCVGGRGGGTKRLYGVCRRFSTILVYVYFRRNAEKRQALSNKRQHKHCSSRSMIYSLSSNIVGYLWSYMFDRAVWTGINPRWIWGGRCGSPIHWMIYFLV